MRRRLALAVLLAALASQIGAVFRQNVSWDEFALLSLADATTATGELRAGGRPGLVAWLLVPLVQGCADEASVVRLARLAWIAIVAAFLAGLALWIAELEPERGRRPAAAALGVALLALVPAFLWASVQVRTDQVGLAGAALGGWLLLASRRRVALALAAGACLGVGFLGSQKSLYLVALAGLLALGQLRLLRELAPRREALRSVLAAAGFAATILAFEAAVALAFQAPEGRATRTTFSGEFVANGLSLFDFYRRTIGLREYREMAPTLVPHALAILALALATPAALRAGGRSADRVGLAWAVLGAGLAVAAFHAAAFRYFWMTLGVFPAVAIAIARVEILAAVARSPGLPPRASALVAPVFVATLALPACLEAASRLRDTQAVQRESLAFVHHEFAPTDAGFQPESALFCQAGRQPIPTHFSQHIYRRYAGPGGERNARALIASFRSLPILFLVESFRLNQFPVEVRRFWAENYQPYRESVFVAGRRVAGARGAELALEIVAPGRYRWIPAGGPHPLVLDGRELAAGEVVELAAGRHQARLLSDVPDGMLVLALDDPPGPAPLPFYEN